MYDLWASTKDQGKKPLKIGSPTKQRDQPTPRWFKMPFSSPSWRSLNPLKGSLNHPKKVTLNHQVLVFLFFEPLSFRSSETSRLGRCKWEVGRWMAPWWAHGDSLPARWGGGSDSSHLGWKGGSKGKFGSISRFGRVGIPKMILCWRISWCFETWQVSSLGRINHLLLRPDSDCFAQQTCWCGFFFALWNSRAHLSESISWSLR